MSFRHVSFVVAFLTCAGIVPAATFHVDTTTDGTDAVPGDGVCATSTGECTLRAAFEEAGALAGNDGVVLPAGTFAPVGGTLVVPCCDSLFISRSSGVPVIDASSLAGIEVQGGLYLQRSWLENAAMSFGSVTVMSVSRGGLRNVELTSGANHEFRSFRSFLADLRVNDGNDVPYTVSVMGRADGEGVLVFGGSPSGTISGLRAQGLEIGGGSSPIVLGLHNRLDGALEIVHGAPADVGIGWISERVLFEVGGGAGSGLRFSGRTGKLVATGEMDLRIEGMFSSDPRRVNIGGESGCAVQFKTHGTGSLLIDGATISGNDCGIDMVSTSGSPEVTIRRAQVTEHDGPGIHVTAIDGATVVLEDVRVDRNAGAGVSLQVADVGAPLAVEVSATSITRNGGRGLELPGPAPATVDLTNVTISSNHTPDSGAGLWGLATVDGRSVTITGNVADDDGDGLGDGGGVMLLGTGTLSLENSILAGNLDSGGEGSDCAGTVQSLGYNVIGSSTGCLVQGSLVGTVIDVDPGLAPLRENPDHRATHGLLPGSPAAEAGNPAGCQDSGGSPLTEDQRGRVRSFAGRCDIGAHEQDFDLRFLDAETPSWFPFAPSKDVIRGQIVPSIFSYDFGDPELDIGPVVCLAEDTSAGSLFDPAVPPPTWAYFFLVRFNPTELPGSYGEANLDFSSPTRTPSSGDCSP